MLLSDRLQNRQNNFDAIRLIAASMVIFGHSYPICGNYAEPYAVLSGYAFTGGLGVQIFFVLSGFLITQSWLTKPELFRFVRNRALRLLPALAVNLLVITLIMGPIVSELPAREYFRHPDTLRYLKSIFLFPIYSTLPGVFLHHPQAAGVNGSLWSLPLEVLMYGGVLALGVTRLLRLRWPVLIVLLLMLYSDLHIFDKEAATKTYFAGVPTFQIARFGIYFVMGSLYYLYREHLPLHLSALPLCMGLLYVSYHSPSGPFFSYFVLPYMVMVLAFAPMPDRLSRLFEKADLSYGVYVYGFPIQQVIYQYLGTRAGVWGLFAIALPSALLCASLSWRFIEKPALRLKNFRFRSVAAPAS